MRGALVVERPGVGGGVDAQHERAGGHEHGVVRTDAPAGSEAPRAQHRGPASQLVGREHGLDVLLLVLLHHDEGEQGLRVVLAHPVERVQDPSTHVGDVGPGLRGGSSGRSTRSARGCSKAS